MIIDMEALPEKTNRFPQTLPEKRQSAAVLLCSGTAKAIDVRRAMVELPEVAKENNHCQTCAQKGKGGGKESRHGQNDRKAR